MALLDTAEQQPVGIHIFIVADREPISKRNRVSAIFGPSSPKQLSQIPTQPMTSLACKYLSRQEYRSSQKKRKARDSLPAVPEEAITSQEGDMAVAKLFPVLHYLHKLATERHPERVTDAELLAQFSTCR